MRSRRWSPASRAGRYCSTCAPRMGALSPSLKGPSLTLTGLCWLPPNASAVAHNPGMQLSMSPVRSGESSSDLWRSRGWRFSPCRLGQPDHPTLEVDTERRCGRLLLVGGGPLSVSFLDDVTLTGLEQLDEVRQQSAATRCRGRLTMPPVQPASRLGPHREAIENHQQENSCCDPDGPAHPPRLPTRARV